MPSPPQPAPLPPDPGGGAPAPAATDAPGAIGRDPAATLTEDAERTAAAARLLAGANGNPVLDRLARLTADLLAAPSAQISLLTTAQTVAAGVGLIEGSVGADIPLEASLCAVTAAYRRPLDIGDAARDPRVAHLGPVRDGAVASYLGAPLITPDGSVVGALCVFDTLPRRWDERDVVLLVQLATNVMSEMELLARADEYAYDRMRWDVALDAAGIGSFDWDLATDRVDWDERMQRVFGYRPDEWVPELSEAMRRIHPDDRESVDAAIESALASVGDYRDEYRVVHPDGSVRWVAARGEVQAGRDGRPARLIGAAYDITEVRAARHQAESLLETMTTGFITVDREWRITYVNPAAQRMVGSWAGAAAGRSFWEAFPGTEHGDFGHHYRHAVATGETVEFEARSIGGDAWYDMRAVPGPDGLALYFLDITARHDAELAAAEAAAATQLLAAVSTELAAVLDAEVAVARLARLVVPTLADWCIVSLFDDGGVRDIGWWHVDEVQSVLVGRYAELRMASLARHSFLAEALRTGEPVVVPGDPVVAIGSLLGPGDAYDTFCALAPTSAVILPMVARGRTVGVLSLYRGEGRPELTERELVVASEVSARAAMALDNARLYAEQRTLADELQRSLLTDVPALEQGELVVRYVPAAEAASVGGDWFDAFPAPDGSMTLVIGDVVGHDTEAAAAMGQLRNLLRGIAWHGDAGPATALAGLDAAMEGLGVDTTATAIVARLERHPEPAPPGAWQLRWSNAGHPPPVSVAADGTVSVLDDGDVDLLLGVDPGTGRHDSTLTVHPGQTVLLYTDGLVERRGAHLDTGTAALTGALTDLSSQPLGSLCDGLLTRLLPPDAHDDIALVAVRIDG